MMGVSDVKGVLDAMEGVPRWWIRSVVVGDGALRMWSES